MGVTWTMDNGEEIPVPQDILSQGIEAQQAFYDNQVERIRMEQAESRRTARRKGNDE